MTVFKIFKIGLLLFDKFSYWSIYPNFFNPDTCIEISEYTCMQINSFVLIV